MRRAAWMTVMVLACLLACLPVAAEDDIDLFGEVPAIEPAPASAVPAVRRDGPPPHPTATQRTFGCPPAVSVRRVPIYESVEVPVYETCSTPRLREVQVPVYKQVRIPVYATRRVPVYEDVCMPVFEALGSDLVPAGARRVRRLAGWRTECYQSGERFERVRCGVRPHRITCGVDEKRVQVGSRTEQRVVGWRYEPTLDCPGSGSRLRDGLLRPCGR